MSKKSQRERETDQATFSRRSCLKLAGSAAFLASAGATSVSTGTATASSTSGYGLSGYGEGLYGDPVEQTVDTTAAGDATFSRENGEYTIDAAGADVWRSDDEYGAVYKKGVCGDVVATATVESQDDTNGWAKSGMMISNDIDAPGSSSGSIILAVTPDNGFALQWDHDDSGYISKSIHGGSASYPCELRLTKSDATFTGEYSTDGGSTWTTVGKTTVDGADSTQDVGVFTCSHNSGTTGTARFTGLTIDGLTPDRSTIDTTAAGDATFTQSDGDCTIDAAGADVWNSDDEYGAVYEEDVSGDVVASVTVESQDDTNGWAKSGMMITNDIGAPASSSGSIILAVTPDNGFALQWDHDDSGYISESIHGGSANYPCDLRLTKSDATFTGEYSTDGGSTWTTVGTAIVDKADSIQDVGVFTCSHNSGTTGTARFTGFTRACHKI